MAGRILTFYLFIGCSLKADAQKISGQIELSSHWEPILYVIRVDDINLHPPSVVDSITLSEEGRFIYSFYNNDPEGILYKIVIPPRGHNYNSIIEGTQDNYFLFSTEGDESIKVSGVADSLFYSLSVEGGHINEQLLSFRNLKKELYIATRSLEDSVIKFPSRTAEFEKMLRAYWFNFADEFKNQVTQMLDSTSNSTILLAGMYYLHQANFGIADHDVLKKYLQKVQNKRSILARNIQQLLQDVDSKRLGVTVPNFMLTDQNGQSVNLYDYSKKMTIVDAWASWCSPCRYANKFQLPEFVDKYVVDDGEISLLSISIDEDESKWKTAIEQDKVTGNQFIDNTKSFGQLLSIDTIPLYVVLDHNHKVIFECISIYQLEDFLLRMNANTPKK